MNLTAKTILTVTFLLPLATIWQGCASEATAVRIHASNNKISKEVSIPDFNAIHTKTSIDIVFTQGPKKVVITAPDNVMPYVSTRVEGGRLIVNYDSDTDPHLEIINNHGTTVTVSAPDVREFYTQSSGNIRITSPIESSKTIKLLTQSSGDISAGTLTAPKVDVTTQSSGDISVGFISCENANFVAQSSGSIKANVNAEQNVACTTQSSGDINISGNCRKASLSCMSNGDILAGNLKAIDSDINTFSSGSVKLNGITYSSKNISVTNGNVASSTVHYYSGSDIDDGIYPIDDFGCPINQSGSSSSYASSSSSPSSSSSSSSSRSVSTSKRSSASKRTARNSLPGFASPPTGHTHSSSDPGATGPFKGKENGYVYVDLGLPSGTKWGRTNIGAERPEEHGDYFAWGEVPGNKKSGKWVSPGSPMYDTATALRGGNWRMPTSDQWKELIDECKWEGYILNGVQGQLVTGPNGATLFLPYANGLTEKRQVVYGGNYWSASYYNYKKDDAYLLKMNSDGAHVEHANRKLNFSVRPVIEN